MRVGLGATLYTLSSEKGGVDGIGRYLQELLTHHRASPGISALTPVSFGALPTSVAGDPLLQGARCLRGFGAGTLASVLGGINFPGASQALSDLDLFHAADHRIPCLRNTPVLATVFDAVPLARPDWLAGRFRRLKTQLFRKTMGWADHICTISEFSKTEILQHSDLREDQVSVTYLAGDARFAQPIAPETLAELRQRLGLPPQFLLNVGTLQPRKNVERLVEAHLALSPRQRQRAPLVIVGRHGWGCPELVARLETLRPEDHIRWLRYVSRGDLKGLFQLATALALPSLYEGFGLPVIEAFNAGLPVVTSKTTSLGEIAAGAALTVDPTDVQAITRALAEVIEDQAARQKLRALGYTRAQAFSWKRCAAQTEMIYAKVIAAGKTG